METVLNAKLPPDQIAAACRRLPGMAPLDMADWLDVNDAYAGQMRLREALLASRRSEVVAQETCAQGAADELLALVLKQLRLRDGFEVAATQVRCPDGRVVEIDHSAPLVTLGHLVQEDFCILQEQGGAYLLTGAVLCFPASWTLAEKLGRPLLGIHDPVDSYTPDLAKRVQRLFDAIRPERGMWRANALFYDTPELFHPRAEADPRVPLSKEPPFLRSERQSLLRLPDSGAVVFSIHTYMINRKSLRPDDARALAER
ncbi:DUF3445 domain-containing protein [Halocynthiibacter sp. C4]|uniref:heme-dependent oxidative N-demethylase family protein n=1 Tax=Halocynthiibacter sp. C4 TaxID=2992758 RepID=UPI00237A9EC6|nr:DUF3445 domain-containing protein [Halocynthiibacter sp. C4]MDE0589914.1 DUF3445 domain-containing protein [Halocynthiibacter sp. C4]